MQYIFTFKKLIISAFSLLFVFPLYGQTITGKWKMTVASVKSTDRATGKITDITAGTPNLATFIEQVIVFDKSGNYILTNKQAMSNNIITTTGTYHINGTHLKMQQTGTDSPGTDRKHMTVDLNNKLPDEFIVESQTETKMILHYSEEKTSGGKTLIVDYRDTFIRQ